MNLAAIFTEQHSREAPTIVNSFTWWWVIHNWSHQDFNVGNPVGLIKIRDLINFVALKDIKPEEEILVNYNGDPTNQEKVWFEI